MSANNDHGPPRRYESEKRNIDSSYPPGQFVAMECGNVLADAQSRRELLAKLKAAGKSANGLLIVQAGVEYPDSAVIFVP